MNFSSKSILSPGHSDKSREPTLSFSSSLSRRRLRSNGSISSSSPMFPTGSKKRGCAFETPEPSSPKVTCIGQVRVNTKKKKKKKQQQQGNKNNRNGDVMSFRKATTTDHHNNHHQEEEGIDCLPHRNPKWVHLPFTICEALRSFGADFNCFQPCGGRSCSSASTSERDNKEEKRTTTTIPSGRTTATTSSCGAIFLRWLMALQEGERVEEKRRRMEEIGEEEEEVERDRIKLVDEMEIEDEEEEEEEELEEARVSICIPPRNALLLMRCRSDPMRMSSLANRFWDSPVAKEVEEEEDDDEYYDQESEGDDEVVQEEEGRDQQEELEMNQESEDDDEVEVEGRNEQKDVVVEEMDPELEEKKHNLDKTQEKLDSEEDTLEEEEEQEQVNSLERDNNLEVEDVVVMVNGFSTEALESQRLEEPKLLKTVTDYANEEKLELGNGFSPETLNSEEPKLEMDAEKDEQEEVVNGSSSSSPEALEVPSLDENPNPKLQEREEEMDERKEGSSSEVEALIELLEEEKPTLAEEVAILYLDEGIEKSIKEEEKEKKVTVEIEEVEEIHEHGNEEKERIVHQLPDCLLLMLYEPKLSMEVSKETWVCSTDFISKKHRRGEVMLINGGDLCKKRINFNSDSNNPTAEVVVAHPPPSMASLIEQKLVNAVAYEPLVLTRCKSEPPLRSFSAKLGF